MTRQQTIDEAVQRQEMCLRLPWVPSCLPKTFKIAGIFHLLSKGLSMSKAHPGFKSVKAKIARKEGVSSAAAGRILGAATRRASAGAKRKNPRLKRVKG